MQGYSSQYQELQQIGRGNFGQAMLVLNKQDNCQYVAKKIMLDGLEQKEQDSAKMEVGLLASLRHPNIVSYKEMFLSGNMLIIIMEYCEVGDLAYHIKRKISKNERFSELEIFNWFVQICLALEYVHGRKIIHRDIKTQNIFLTGNNTIKLGDFGISKVLETTMQNAQTVVGTPYYMAPEACQSQPYTSKSDVWALGCILYELCSLRKAFEADNLLGLVFKIVTEPIKPIPQDLPYSREIRLLIDMLLEKDPKLRPSVAQILKMNLIKTKMREFVQSKGKTLEQGTAVYVKQVTTVQQPQQKQQLLQAIDPNETPKQRIARKKQEEADRRAKELAMAARGAQQNFDTANKIKSYEHQTHYGKQQVPFPNLQQKPVQYDEDYTMNFGTVKTLEQTPERKEIMIDFTPSPTRSKYSSHKDDFDDYQDHIEDYKETQQAQLDHEQLQNQIEQYETILLSKQDLESQLALKNEEIQAQMAHQQQLQREQAAMANAKALIRQKLGAALYDEIYKFLVYHRSQGETDEESLFEEIKYRVNDSKKLQEVFKLDGIVFREIVNHRQFN